MAISYLSACATSVAGGEPPSNLAPWDISGIWTKIEGQQQGNANYFPNPYNKDAAGQANTVFGQLDRWTWYRGIHYGISWGDIETAPGVYNWTETDFILNTVGGLTRATGQNKKVMFLLAWKAFGSGSVPSMMPDDLLTQPSPNTYANGQPRWHRTIGWTSSHTAVGYHMRLMDFRNGLTGNDRGGQPIYTLRDRYYAFLQAMHDRYKDHAAFRGVVTLEPTPTDPNEMWSRTGAGAVDTSLPLDGYDRNQYFAGRLELLKKMKQIFTKQIVAEACNADPGWVDQMTLGTSTNGMLTHKIAFTAPNFHTSAQNTTECLYNAMDFLSDKVPILNSCQPFDMDSKRGQAWRSGANNDCYNFLPTPPNYGQPRTMIENENVTMVNNQKVILAHDPPDYAWIIARAQYLKSNVIILQNNYASVGANNAPRYNFGDFSAAMNANTTVMSPNTGGLIQNDPAGGMVTTRPLHVAGD